MLGMFPRFGCPEKELFLKLSFEIIVELLPYLS